MAGRTAGFCRGTAERGKKHFAGVGKMPDHHVWSISPLAQRVTGSEGGFAAEEAARAAECGAVTVGLGPRILRCETAPVVALTAAMYATGNLS